MQGRKDKLRHIVNSERLYVNVLSTHRVISGLKGGGEGGGERKLPKGAIGLLTEGRVDGPEIRVSSTKASFGRHTSHAALSVVNGTLFVHVGACAFRTPEISIGLVERQTVPSTSGDSVVPDDSDVLAAAIATLVRC